MSEQRIVSCASCPCGHAAGIGSGGSCPLIDRRKERGEYLFFEGEPATHVWFVKRGTVVLARGSGEGEGQERARAVRKAGAFVGLEALVQPTYLDTARVTSSTTVCGATLAAVNAWLGAPGTPARVALEQVLRATGDDAPRAAGPDGNAVRRVARWLLADQQSAGPLPRRDVAGLLGMVPETLSRALAQLSDLGAVEVTRRSLRVRDPSALRAAAGL